MSELLDQRTQRVRALKEIIARLHAEADVAAVRDQLRQLVRECDASEIAQMEQELIAGGMAPSQIAAMCDLHSSLAREILSEQPMPLLPAWHPVKTFQRENEAIERQVGLLRAALSALAGPEAAVADRAAARERCRALVNDLMDVDKHYSRKEHLLFPMLERHGIAGPSQVMWAKDDEARRLLTALRIALAARPPTPEGWASSVDRLAAPALAALTEMIAKEERILLPMSLRTLTEQEWREIWEQSPQFGWCLVDPDPSRPPQAPQPAATAPPDRSGLSLSLLPPAAGRAEPAANAIPFPTGSLTPAQLLAIFSTLPVDLTFVDADDRVRFFSEGPDRIFVRPAAVIGRKVQNCHPPESLHVVNRIIDDFRAGRQHVAEFWVELHKPRTRFVHIRYFALRDERGVYLGTLEVTQDITHERALSGERRLLHFDQPAQPA